MPDLLPPRLPHPNLAVATGGGDMGARQPMYVAWRPALLGIAGHTTRVVHDGAAAVEAAALFRPELVFLDIGMPFMAGYEAARRMRRMPALAGAMLVALTGWGTDVDRARSRAAGFDRHLLKPAVPDDVEAVLAAAAAAAAAANAPA